MLIEHNPKERRPTNTVWWVLLVGLAAAWVSVLWFGIVDWKSAALGAATAGVFVLGMTEFLERRSPGSVTGKPRR